MKSKRWRLDRFLRSQLAISQTDIHLLLAQGRITVDHRAATGIQQFVDEYTHVKLDDQVLQDKVPSYLQLHKPKGVVSATTDRLHPTVIDLLPDPRADNLHIVGRLDFNSTGLVLITNDGRWSRMISDPSRRIEKRYRVVLDKPATPDVVTAFSQGIHFGFEGITTRPALLSVLAPTVVEVTLTEGRYHQIKRMFGRFNIRVIALHRISVGALVLDNTLLPGQSRYLSASEVAVFGG